MRFFLSAAILCLSLTPLPSGERGRGEGAGEKTVPRYIEFRDGSILRLNVIDEDWPITIIRENGGVKDAKVKLSALHSFTLTTEKGFAEKRKLLSAVRKLGSEDFWDREKAMAELTKLGPEIRADLETCLGLITDLEAVVRIKRIMSAYPKPAANETAPPINFDLFYLKETCWGHLGDQGIPILYQGKTHRLGRADVKRLSVAMPAPLAGLSRFRGGVAAVRRLGATDFPAGCIEEGFERAPDGRFLQVGDDIEKTFIPKGFVLSTSFANSFVSVNSFTVSGKSRGFSIANHQPLWEGEITIKFVLPGREDVPAGVTHFGCYIAAVVPKGTALVAEDIDGRELGRVETANNGHDFIGISSTVPMHKIRVVPDTKLDRDYTLDDFIFTTPQSVEATHPDKYTAYLDMGQAHSRDVIFTKDQVHILGLPGSLPDLIVPRAEVRRINAPDLPEKTPSPEEQTRIDDFIKQLGSDSFEVRKVAQKGLEDIGPIALRALRKTVKNGAVLETKRRCEEIIRRLEVHAEKNRRLEARDYFVELRDGSLLTGQLKPGKSRPEFPLKPDLHLQPEQIVRQWHRDSPRFVPRPRLPTGTWLIHTKTGDEIVLDGKTPITGKWSGGLSARWQGKPLRLAGTEIRAISRIGDQEPPPKINAPKNLDKER